MTHQRSLAASIVVCALATWLACSSDTTVAGGTSQTGSARVTGRIVDSTGVGVAGAVVRLRQSTYLTGTQRDDGKPWVARDTVTDDSGWFFCDNVDAGEYAVEAVDQSSRAVLTECAVNPGDDAVDLGSAIPASVVSVTGTATLLGGGSSAIAVRVFGMEHATVVDLATGRYRLDGLPSGAFALYAMPQSRSFESRRIVSGSLTPGEARDLGAVTLVNFSGEDYTLWRYSRFLAINTQALGVADTVVNFPLLVRLESGTFNFSESGSPSQGADIRFAKTDGTHLPYQIEQWDGTRAAIWVFVDTIYGNSSDHGIRMHWGRTDRYDWSNGSTVFDTGFAGVWHLGDRRPFGDATVNANHGEDSGSSDAPGIIGRARYFDEKSYGAVPDNALLEPASLTLSCWVKADGLPDSLDKIIDKGNPDVPFESYSLEWRSHSGLAGIQISTTDSLCPRAISRASVADGGWHLLAGTFDESTRTGALFIDGSQISTYAANAPINYYPGRTYALYFGTQHTLGAFYRGAIDEARLDRVARSAGWMKLTYENQRVGSSLIEFR